jgi:hypothetical protein
VEKVESQEYRHNSKIFTDFEEQIKNDQNLKLLHETMQNFEDDAEESYNGGVSDGEFQEGETSLKKGLNSLSSLKYGID